MAIAIIVTDRNVETLKKNIENCLNNETPVWIYPNIPNPDQVKMVILWKQPKGVLSTFPNLKLISSLGAGVEHILADPYLDKTTKITRIVDKKLPLSMSKYVLMAILNIHKNFSFYQKKQQNKSWARPTFIETPLIIGILGLGALGRTLAKTLVDLEFEVLGYSQNKKNIPGVKCFSGADTSLTSFVSKINLLVCLLPRTPATEAILNYELFKHLPKNSYLVNVARGAHLVEADLIKAIEGGFIQLAYLDVFQEEPLPTEHAFWEHPNIIITPHIASVTDQESAAQIIAENYFRLIQGTPLLFEVDRKKGY